MNQYRRDRNPADLIFRSRAVVHFAVDQDAAMMTTRLAGRETVFLPFNQGSNGPGIDDGKGNPPNPRGPRTAYLWEQAWAARQLARPARFLRPRRAPARQERQEDRADAHDLPAVPPVGRRHQAARGSPVRGAGSRQARAALGRLGQVQHHRLVGQPALAAAHARRGLGAGGRRQRCWPRTERPSLRQDHRRHRPSGAGPAAAGHRGRLRAHPRDDRQDRPRLRTAPRRAGGQAGADHHHHLAEVPVVAQSATDLAGTRFAVIVDEAHSSQSGEAAKDLEAVLSGLTGDAALAAAEGADSASETQERDVEDLLADSVAARRRQPNLSFFAFTATPKHKTLSLFGERVVGPDGEERYMPFHLYSMRQAIEEGFILDVLADYTTYATYYRLANGLGAEDREVPKGKGAAALARSVSLHPTNIGQRGDVIVEHFRHHTSTKIGGRAKAMVVTPSRLHAVRYYQAIQKAIEQKRYDRGPAPIRALVAFSGTVTDPDNPTADYREPLMNGFPESQLPERFAGPEYRILVVADKYQTGFDQPLLHHVRGEETGRR